RKYTICPALIPIVFIPRKRTVLDIHWISPATYLNHRRVIKKLAKTLYLNSGRGDNHLEVWPLWKHLSKIAQQKVNIQTALVCFINNQRVVAIEITIILNLGQQDAVCHHLYARLF